MVKFEKFTQEDMAKDPAEFFNTIPMDEIIDMTDRFYVQLADRYAAAVPGKRVNEYMLHWFTHVQINAFIHLLTHVSDEQTALREIKPVMEMLIESWMKYILIDE